MFMKINPGLMLLNRCEDDLSLFFYPELRLYSVTSVRDKKATRDRHCEERSDAAIQELQGKS